MTVGHLWTACVCVSAFAIITGWTWLLTGAIVVTGCVTAVGALHVAVDRMLDPYRTDQ